MQKEITEGRGKAEFIDLTKEIGEAMCYSTPCSMGQVSAKAALSATELFTKEYEEHIKKKNCPAGACTSFVNIYIDPHCVMVVENVWMYVQKTVSKEKQNTFI